MRSAFLGECTSRLQEASASPDIAIEDSVAEHSGNDVYNSAAHRAARCIQVLQEFCESCQVRLMNLLPWLVTLKFCQPAFISTACKVHTLFVQGKSMPIVPAHAASYVGPQLRIEVQASGFKNPGRVPLDTASNCYVGGLRRQVAEQLDCPPENVRMIVQVRHLA